MHIEPCDVTRGCSGWQLDEKSNWLEYHSPKCHLGQAKKIAPSLVMSIGVAPGEKSNWLEHHSTKCHLGQPKKIAPSRVMSIGVAPDEKLNWLDQSTSTKCHLGEAKIVCTRLVLASLGKTSSHSQLTLWTHVGQAICKQLAWLTYIVCIAYRLCKLKRYLTYPIRKLDEK